MSEHNNGYNIFWKSCGGISFAFFIFTIIKVALIGASVWLLVLLFCFMLTIPEKKVVVKGWMNCHNYYLENNNLFFWVIDNKGSTMLIHLREPSENLVKKLVFGYRDKFEIEGKIVFRHNKMTELPLTENPSYQPFYQNEKDFQEIWNGISDKLRQSILKTERIYPIKGKIIFLSIKGGIIHTY